MSLLRSRAQGKLPYTRAQIEAALAERSRNGFSTDNQDDLCMLHHSATHEAAHAVVGAAWGIRIRRIVVTADTSGYTLPDDGGAGAAERRVVMALAGPHASYRWQADFRIRVPWIEAKVRSDREVADATWRIIDQKQRSPLRSFDKASGKDVNRLWGRIEQLTKRLLDAGGTLDWPRI